MFQQDKYNCNSKLKRIVTIFNFVSFVVSYTLNCLSFKYLFLCLFTFFIFQPKEGKKVSWLEVDEDKLSFTCWVCKMYPAIANSSNVVYTACSKWHVNYPIRHEKYEKHKVSLLFPC